MTAVEKSNFKDTNITFRIVQGFICLIIAIRICSNWEFALSSVAEFIFKLETK